MITFKAKTASGEIINSALSPFTFPAGEAHIKHADQRELEAVEIAILQPSADSLHTDLFHLAMWADYLDRTSNEILRVLILPYVPGARADRGVPFGLGVYSHFINKLYLDQIIIFDPHSEITNDVFGDEEDNLTIVYSDELFDQVHMRAVLHGYDGIIAPDKGAVERASAVAEVADLPVFTATKERDEDTGRLSNFAIEGLDPEGVYLIVDDICDGGGTFLGLAEASGLDYGQLDLYVSHGVFSKDALHNLKQKFEYIYTTNSYYPGRQLNELQRDDSGEVIWEEPTRPFRRFDVIRLLESKILY